MQNLNVTKTVALCAAKLICKMILVSNKWQIYQTEAWIGLGAWHFKRKHCETDTTGS